MLVLAILAGWIAVSIPVTLGIAHAAHLAAEREAVRRPVALPRRLRTADPQPLRRTA